MTILAIISLILFSVLGIIITLISAFFIYAMIGSLGCFYSPPIPSSGKVEEKLLQDICNVLKRKKNQTIMDLGSGWGTLLLPLAKKCPNHNFVGYERGFFPYWISVWRARKLKNIKIYHDNLFNANLNKADIIIVFLLPHTLKQLQTKCQQEMKKDTLIYSNRFKFPDMKPYKVCSFKSDFETYYIYKI